MKTMFDFLVWLVGIVIGVWLYAEVVELIHSDASALKQQAIERGYALYCPADGKFAWVGECEQKGE